jgi:tetratricopeptide (TPR) repeat protein
MTSEEIEEHNRAFEQASRLVKGEMILDGGRPPLKLSREARVKLDGALHLLARVLELNPKNWSAMWLVGKVHQRLDNYAVAFTFFGRAHEINPTQPDVAREASLCAMSMGHPEDAISYARSAVQSRSNDNGLKANLALAFLLAGRLNDAKTTIESATAGDPSDTVSQTIRDIIEHFIAVGRTPPKTPTALEEYWKLHKQASSDWMGSSKW